MYRSGSTFLYNAVRILYVHTGVTTWGGDPASFVGTDGTEANVYLIKTHPWFEELADYSDGILTSYRPVAEAWRSYNRFKEDEEDQAPWQATRDWVDWFEKWRRHESHRYTMYWDDFMDDDGPWNALKDVAHLLGFGDVNLIKCMKHLRSDLAPPSEKKNPDTLIFPNHYTARDYEEDVLPRLRVPERDLP